MEEMENELHCESCERSGSKEFPAVSLKNFTSFWGVKYWHSLRAEGIVPYPNVTSEAETSCASHTDKNQYFDVHLKNGAGDPSVVIGSPRRWQSWHSDGIMSVN
jgi:hypothetical protein